MGMYNDRHGNNRDGWSFPYTGAELLKHAERKRDQMRTQEMEARNEMSRLLADPSQNASSAHIDTFKHRITEYATVYEQCVIWCHEFERNREREYNLKLGDVSFFEIPNALEGGTQL